VEWSSKLLNLLVVLTLHFISLISFKRIEIRIGECKALTMAQPVNPQFLERYQQEYQKDPRSRVFAPLAEGYRKLGLLDEALKIAQAGVKIHPNFASGRVALAKILIDLNQDEAASHQLQAAVKISPDNLLANSLLGETWLKLRRPKEALKSFKMVLFIDPSNEHALAAVKKWEFLTADEYGDEAFDEVRATKVTSPNRQREIDRAISLADAFTIRNEPDRAYDILHSAHKRLGDDGELNSRLDRLRKRLQIEDEVAEPIRPIGTVAQAQTKGRNRLLIERLERLLQRIEKLADDRTGPVRS
jgi:tetratricopeptide (TPR) repeat protein